MPSPLLGYNTNVRHHGKLYHIQTEDSGVQRPHIITHLFADGGRIIASKKTTYGDILGTDDLQARVKQMMRDQHKAMFIELRDGIYDEENSEPTQEVSVPPVDPATLDAAAAQIEVAPPKPARESRYQSTRPAQPSEPANPASIFGGDLLSEKSLDEVILSYLAEDLDEDD